MDCERVKLDQKVMGEPGGVRADPLPLLRDLLLKTKRRIPETSCWRWRVIQRERGDGGCEREWPLQFFFQIPKRGLLFRTFKKNGFHFQKEVLKEGFNKITFKKKFQLHIFLNFWNFSIVSFFDFLSFFCSLENFFRRMGLDPGI